MTIHYNVPGKKRKVLAEAIGAWLGVNTRYCGAPTFAYQIDYFTLDKDGTLTFDDRADSEVIERLIEYLYDNNFEFDAREEERPPIEVEEIEEDCSPPYETPTAEEPTTICISMPESLFTETALQNLEALVKAKGSLIKQAFGVDELPVSRENGKVSFPWFPGVPTPSEIKAYDTFICKLCEMARTQKRVTATEKEVDNEKYAFRCFLLRLGFIGSEYKAERKILLRNFSGSSAFKNSKTDEMEVNG